MSDILKFETEDAFYEHFRRMANESDSVLTDDFIIEGNNDITFGWVNEIAQKIGYTNVWVENRTDCMTEIFLDLRENPDARFDLIGDEITYDEGIVRMWFD